MKKNIFLQTAILVFISTVFFSFTNPLPTSKFLFKIGRSVNTDEVYYTVNLDKYGNLVIKKPINIYWVRNEKNKEHEPLTWIQQNFSYGLKILSASPDEVKFQFVSYDKRKLVLKKDANGVFKVYMPQSNTMTELNSVFVQIDGGTFWVPTISKVEIYTTNPENYKNYLETIIP